MDPAFLRSDLGPLWTDVAPLRLDLVLPSPNLEEGELDPRRAVFIHAVDVLQIGECRCLALRRGTVQRQEERAAVLQGDDAVLFSGEMR